MDYKGIPIPHTMIPTSLFINPKARSLKPPKTSTSSHPKGPKASEDPQPPESTFN